MSVLGMLLYPAGSTWGQAIPMAPPVPTCSWESDGIRSTCKFKDALSGTPTSLIGNRVILFDRSTTGGHQTSRIALREALNRLADRYGFTVTATENPSIFTKVNLADAKVVVLSSGDGDVVPPGANRTALEDFQQVSGWGLLWIHAACSFITSGWPFGQQSCVQQYFHHNASGTPRRVFIDSGTTANPNHGIRNPQTEFLLRDLPGWSSDRTAAMTDEWFCFRAPARNTEGVNVLFGYDRSSGRTSSGCPLYADSSEASSRNHNLAWTHTMGRGITIFNSWGHDREVYTVNMNMGDSLLWRYLRYAAKDWCIGGGGEPGCDVPVAVRAAEAAPKAHSLRRNGVLSLYIPGKGRREVSLMDMSGRRVKTISANGGEELEIRGMPRGMYLVQIGGGGKRPAHRIMVY